ncbi:conserved hypothetical protein [Synechococcus sp. PCC 7335]|uniref:DUF1350 family protein n=1 Tax=Synechococcus sp. (strain ATCC 29403 / PCC 7335) TaxID=91464 RepID=UPI00017EE78D|nr:DUF1350 family protein [Synechococcus sp. PCC 7335]EDX84294.1 conserved hypothetical protein [Synechococcus sp. PCC 7335]
MYWQEVSGNWFLVPKQPKAIVHFLGGAFVAAAPHLTYRWLLEALYQEGYAVIATPFVNTFDHGAIASETLTTFNQGMVFLRKQRPELQDLPIYGLGHSMGCKVHLLIGSMLLASDQTPRVGNIFISFNNYPARKSIPLLEQFTQLVPDFQLDTRLEFVPSPEQTLELINTHYSTPYNLLLKFRNDTIDQTRPLSDVLIKRFPTTTTVRILRGSHTTPIAQDVQWEANSSFSPFDAIGQFVKQEFYRDIKQLKVEILYWLKGE